MTFNARRGGEVSKLKLKHCNGVEDGRWKRRTDLDELDDPIEKKLARRMQLCYIEGKKKKAGNGALVPVLFTVESVKAIRLIIKHRAYAGVSPDNDFVFASGELFLRDWDTLQAFTRKIESLKKPNLITPM